MVAASVGPKVDGLKAGDKVLMTGQINVTYWEVPKEKNLIVVREANVVLVQ